jgi:hypothetical protein
MSTLLDLPEERALPEVRQAAARAQLARYASSRRERIAQRMRRAGLALGLGLGVIVAGGATAATVYLTKGPIPTVNGRLDFARAPDFISVASNGAVVGFEPKRYVIPSRPGTPENALGTEVAPIYGPDLKTLVGHMYPGVGFVPLGHTPQSVPCLPESSSSNGTTSTIPCPSVSERIPEVVGMSTPSGVVALQSAGVTPHVENEQSTSIPSGHIVQVSPSSGTTVRTRTPVEVFNSLGP